MMKGMIEGGCRNGIRETYAIYHEVWDLICFNFFCSILAVLGSQHDLIVIHVKACHIQELAILFIVKSTGFENFCGLSEY